MSDALAAIERIRGAQPGVPVLIGGRVTPETIAAARAGADGAIIGSALKADSGMFTRIDDERARAFSA